MPNRFSCKCARRKLAVLVWAVWTSCGYALADDIETQRLPDFRHWKPVTFSGLTHYEYQSDANGDLIAFADSRAAASGLVHEATLALDPSTWLVWKWKLIEPIQTTQDEKSKAGDDFALRLYVVKKGLFPWQTHAINYVWSRQYPVGDSWPNPFTRNAMMVVVASGRTNTGQWQVQKRNIVRDFKNFFNQDITALDAVAIMTDTDNSKTAAKAAYGPIYLTTPAVPGQ